MTPAADGLISWTASERITSSSKSACVPLERSGFHLRGPLGRGSLEVSWSGPWFCCHELDSPVLRSTSGVVGAGPRFSRLWPPSPSPRGAVLSLLWLLPSPFGRSVCAIAFGPDCDFFVVGPYILMNTKAFLLNVRTSKVKTVPSGET